jgi:hypothetical protein
LWSKHYEPISTVVKNNCRRAEKAASEYMPGDHGVP